MQHIEANRRCLIFWENVSPEATRALLNKKLFGYRTNDKIYVGAVQKFGGQKLGKGCISVPAWNMKPVAEIFSSLNVRFKVMEVMELGETLTET